MDLILDVMPSEEDQDYEDYVAQLQNSLKGAYHQAALHSSKAKARQKQKYDEKARELHLQPRDRVLIANKSQRGKQKLEEAGRLTSICRETRRWWWRMHIESKSYETLHFCPRVAWRTDHH